MQQDDGQLDNPVWTALTGPQAAMGTVLGGAARFDPDFCPFASVRDAADTDAWRDLRSLIDTDETIALPGMRREDVPADWAIIEEIPCYQMVSGKNTPLRRHATATIEPLGLGDVSSMLELVDKTEPGPFRDRTVEMGPYLGIWGLRPTRTLAAMSGVRLQTEGWNEVSAVCTDPRFRNRGYGRQLVEQILRFGERNQARSFLHVRVGNPAMRLYEALDFTMRRDFSFLIVSAT